MNLLYRFILFIIIIVFMFSCLMLALYALPFTGLGSELLPGLVRSVYNQWEAGLLLLLGFIAGAWLIYPFFSRQELRKTSIAKSELGEVDISLDALDKLVYKVAVQQEGIVEITSRLKNTDSGLHIYLTGKILPDIPVPRLTENLQHIVKSYLEDTTGVTVAEVRVLIEGVSQEHKKLVE